MVDEARLEKKENSLTPTSDGWFILHPSQAPWFKSERFGLVCNFEGDARFPQVGINIRVLEPGQPASLYHREDGQEGFLVLSGECLVVIEEQERQLRAGDFVHCPPRTTHVFVGAGEGPCAILMLGFRPPDSGLHYPVSKLAAKYGASVDRKTDDPREAYGGRVFEAASPPAWPFD